MWLCQNRVRCGGFIHIMLQLQQGLGMIISLLVNRNSSKLVLERQKEAETVSVLVSAPAEWANKNSRACDVPHPYATYPGSSALSHGPLRHHQIPRPCLSCMLLTSLAQLNW